MTDYIELINLPIDEREPFTWHLESIRRMLWILNHLNAGSAPLDYDTGYNATEWYDFVDALDADGPDFPAEAGKGIWCNIMFTRPTVGGNWLCTFIGTGLTKTQMRSAFPFDSAGVIQPSWAYGVDYNRYADWDENANRKEAFYNTKPGTEDFWSMHAYSRDWLPKQILTGKQNFPVKYTNTGRVIPRRLLDVEIARQYITDPGSMGPIFDMIGWRAPASYTTICTKVVEDCDIGVAGYQYGCAGGHPYNDGGETEMSPWTDAKVRPAYQNQVERACCLNSMGWKVDPTEDWGAQFKLNYIRMYWHGGMTAIVLWTAGWYPYGWEVKDASDNWWKVINVAGTTAEPSSGVPTEWELQTGSMPDDFEIDVCPQWASGSWAFRRQVHHNNQLWKVVNVSGTSVEPTFENYTDWEWQEGLPTWAPLNNECWGCNESGFELLLWIYGKYDWYFCTSHPYVPQRILIARYDLANVTYPPWTEAEINAAFPLPAGTWRRTWAYSMGAPKNAMDMMWPLSKGEPTHDDQDEWPGDPNHKWIGMWNPEVPTISLSESEAAEIARRHGPSVVDNGVPCYELDNEIVDDMWALLEMLKYNFSDASVTIEMRTVSPATTALANPLTEWKWQEAMDLLELQSWSTTETGSIEDDVSGSSTDTSGSLKWDIQTTIRRSRLRIDGGMSAGRYLADKVSLLFNMSGSSYVPFPPPYPGSSFLCYPAVTIALPDGDTFDIEMYDTYAGNVKQTLQCHYATFPIEQSAETVVYVPIDRAGAIPQPNFPWNATANGQFGQMVSQAYFAVVTPYVGGGVLLVLDFSLIPTSVWADYTHPTPDVVAVDDEKFNAAGILI